VTFRNIFIVFYVIALGFYVYLLRSEKNYPSVGEWVGICVFMALLVSVISFYISGFFSNMANKKKLTAKTPDEKESGKHTR
jgi:O-antigen/teichoic acid export membrane protein